MSAAGIIETLDGLVLPVSHGDPHAQFMRMPPHGRPEDFRLVLRKSLHDTLAGVNAGVYASPQEVKEGFLGLRLYRFERVVPVFVEVRP